MEGADKEKEVRTPVWQFKALEQFIRTILIHDGVAENAHVFANQCSGRRGHG